MTESSTTKALKLALSLLHEERTTVTRLNPPVTSYLDEVDEAIGKLESMHRMYKQLDEVRARMRPA